MNLRVSTDPALPHGTKCFDCKVLVDSAPAKVRRTRNVIRGKALMSTISRIAIEKAVVLAGDLL
jgi:hypothetical protein